MHRQLMLPVTLFSLLIVSVAHAGFNEGIDALKKGDYAKAYEEFKTAAEQGNTRAQFNLGVMYETGKGVEQNYVEAAKYYSMSAEQQINEKESKTVNSPCPDFLWFGEIDSKAVANALAYCSQNKPKRLILNSNGGSVENAIAFYDVIKNVEKMDLTIIGVGQISSAAVTVLCAGKKRLISKNAYMVFHEIKTIPSKDGPKRACDKRIGAEQRILLTQRQAQIISSTTGGKVSPEEVIRMMQEGTLLTAWDIVKKGIATGFLSE